MTWRLISTTSRSPTVRDVTVDDRSSPDIDPGGDYLLNEPGFAVIRSLLAPGSTLLDIGCGHGNVGAFFARADVAVDGIEPDSARAHAAESRLRRVDVGTLADAVGSADLRERYDVVTMIDVLEHVASPDEALRQASTFMGPDSRLFLFLPNSAHWSFRLKVLRGDWSYADWGLFDRTHLRFFDLTTAGELGPAAGLVETQRWASAPGRALTSRYGPRYWPNLFAVHFLFELRKA